MTEERLRSLREYTLWKRLREVATDNLDKPALISRSDDGAIDSLTYAELMARAEALSAGLATAGVRRGDRLALWMTNRLEWAEVFLATARIGAVLAPASTRLQPPELAFLVRQSGSRHLVLMDRFRRIDFVVQFAEIVGDEPRSAPGRFFSEALPDLRTVIVAPRDGGGDLAAIRGAGEEPRARALAEQMEAEVRGGDLGMIKYTSGSTGTPKGALLEQGGIVANAILHSERLRCGAAERWFNPNPFFHAGGSIWGLMSTLMQGATLVFTEAFRPHAALEMIERERCTVSFGVPAMIRDELDVLEAEPGRYDVSSLRICVASRPDIGPRAIELMGVSGVWGPYGMTETYGTIAVADPTDSLEHQLHTQGKILDGVESRIVDPLTGEVLPRGKVGEINLRGLVTRGYHEQPEASADLIDAEGWMHTGDLAMIDEDDYVYYRGRAKLMLKVGSENVSVEEVENCVTEHEAVLDCVVCGVPHPRLDQVPRAMLTFRPGEAASDDELREWCEARLARFKVPDAFVVADALPMTGSGKLDRAAAERAMLAEVELEADPA
ncbi:MAG: AMP-binding protein [Solirubrobacterales bacterium]